MPETVKEQFTGLFTQLKGNKIQFCLAIWLAMMCGATKKLSLFPVPFLGGPSTCKFQIPAAKAPKGVTAPGDMTAVSSTNDTLTSTYSVGTWDEKIQDCDEEHVFIIDSALKSFSSLAVFGFAKALCNFIVGGVADRYGRKNAEAIGWVFGIPIPFMIMFAANWETVSWAFLFLGIQQGLAWSTTIFIMADYAGKKRSGIAIGINETFGYTSVAVFNLLGAVLMEAGPSGDIESYRFMPNIVTMVIIFSSLLVSLFFLKESKGVVAAEEKKSYAQEEADFEGFVALTWPGKKNHGGDGGDMTDRVNITWATFVYTSFMNASMASICQAGLMINFLTALAWSLLVKWIKAGGEGEASWKAFEKAEVAEVLLCYGLCKGLLQWIFGFLGDRYGRKKFIVAGLYTCSVALAVMVVASSGKEDVRGLFYFGALLLGTGTAMMYTNNLAAIADHAHPTYRATSLGAYRFWRDLGYAVGGLVLGALSDSIGRAWTVGVVTILVALSATTVLKFYKENSSVHAATTPKVNPGA